MYFHRTLEKVLNEISPLFKGIMISGMRQVGKSTMLKHCGHERRYLTLNQTKLLQMAKSAPEEFLRLNPPPLSIDEVQWAPELFPALKEYFDQTDVRDLVWLSGSQRLPLWSLVSDKLPGRIAAFDLMPFSIYERNGLGLEQEPYVPGQVLPNKLKSLGVQETWQVVFQGAWPDVLSLKETAREIYFDQLINLYISNDVIELNSIGKRLEFRRFLSVLAARSGQEIRYSDISKACGINLVILKQWLSILEASGLIFLLPPFFENVEKRLVKSPKLYFVDTGLLCYLLDIQSAQELARYYNRGAIFETFVISELLKSWVHNGKKPTFYFYRDFEKNEIDVLIHTQGQYFPVEIKSSVNVEAKKVQSIASFRELMGDRCGAASVISMTDTTYAIAPGVVNHSIWSI